MVIEGLQNSQEKSAQDLAYDLARKWVQSNHLAYVKYEGMYEKVKCKNWIMLVFDGLRMLNARPGSGQVHLISIRCRYVYCIDN